MKQTLLCIFSFLFFQIGFSQTTTPEVIATSGDYFSNANNSLSWTIGECITETYTTANNSLTQGFQQSHYNITAVHENSKCNLAISIYPNPASTFINISSRSSIAITKMKVDVLDISGKLIHSEFFQNNTRLTISEYSNTLYFLNIYDVNNDLIKTFKLQKTN